MHLVDLTVRPAGAPDADDMESEALRPARGPAADMADAEDQEALSRDPAVEGRLPARAALVGDDARQLVVEHEERHDGVFVGLGPVHAAAVGEDNTPRQP